MKTSIFTLLFALLFQVLAAQGIFQMSVDSVSQSYQDVDLSDNALYFNFDGEMMNIGDSEINVGWKFVEIQNCPDEWNLVISDKYLEYIINEISESTFDINLTTGESAPFNFIVFPKIVPGCCTAQVQFFNAENTNEIFDTSYYHFEVNVENCITTNIQDVMQKTGFHIYPNPVQSSFNLPTDISFEQGKIYSFDGQLVKTFDGYDRKIQIDQLNSGLYHIVLIDSSQLKKTSTFLKK